ncbi:MAG: transcriptional regulator [Eubacteriales bacterium]|nr:transcriptional regulator [Eubacteriales bacterium]
MDRRKEKLIVQAQKIKELRSIAGLNRTQFAKAQGIPLRTIEEWEAGRRKMPDYVLRLLSYKVRSENMDNRKNKNINIIRDESGKSIVLINDIRFKSRRKIDWNQVEMYLKEYIGECYEIIETSEKIYIGTDFPDEFCHSKDKIRLKGANEKAKANMVQAISELIYIATDKVESEDYEKKHKAKAEYGWYRYNTRFGIPKYNSNGELEGYNIYTAKMLVRCDEDGKLYLYDFVRTKKETSSPSEL